VAGVLQLLGVPFTGSPAEALQLCKDKATTKKIVGYDGVSVPKFSLVRRGEVFSNEDFTFPAIVKPLNREASEGIAKASVVQDFKMAVERVTFIHEKLASDVIVEEFIHGRELYVGVLAGIMGIRVLPPRELFMRELKSDQAMVATYQAKWNEDYRKRWGIGTAKANSVSTTTNQQLVEGSLKIFSTLRMSGYARIDWRINEFGEAMFLEANPNPALAMDDDFAKSAKTAGIGYQELILEIITAAVGSQVIGHDAIANRQHVKAS
jgi:D-alanine-D-alanine ligase